MRTPFPLLMLAAGGLTATTLQAATPAPSAKAAAQWWTDIAVLADDNMEGRLPGTPGFQHAADYVVSRFKAEGLAPKGVDGSYLQPVAFEQQLVDQKASTLELAARTGEVTPLKVGELSRISPGGAPLAEVLDAPLVFLGYGLSLPKQGADDFAGMDLKGKVVVVISGGPAQISGAIKSNARFARMEQLGKLGAVGMISLTTPKQVEIPWARQMLLAGQSGMYLADADAARDARRLREHGSSTRRSRRCCSAAPVTASPSCARWRTPQARAAFRAADRLKGSIVASARPVLAEPGGEAARPRSDAQEASTSSSRRTWITSASARPSTAIPSTTAPWTMPPAWPRCSTSPTG